MIIDVTIDQILDLILVRFFVEMIGHMMAYLFIATVLYALDEFPWPHDLGYLLLGWSYYALFTLTLATVVAPLSEMSEVLDAFGAALDRPVVAFICSHSHYINGTAEILRRERGNPDLLPGITLPDSVAIETDGVRALAGCSMLLVAVPTAFLREVLRDRAGLVPAELPVVSLVKGIETGSLSMPSDIIRREWGMRPVAVLSGPSHAEEVARGLPAAVVVASSDPSLAKAAQERIMTDRFRVYTNSDMTGVEWAGALKNVIGIAAGICDGLELGDNAKAAMLTRGLAEIARSGEALGADPATFSGLAGVGDLLTTCFKIGRAHV